ncbi:MAG TPA: FxsA family protein, partial [Acidimicrobiales bacterium]
MFLVLFLLLPIVELYVFVQVAGAIGFGSALLTAVGATVVGVWLVKQQGLGVLRRANDKVTRGEAPTDEVVNGTLLLLAGLLLLVPGFITGAVGLALLLPPVRAL